MQHITKLSSIIDRYDALLLDLWGVVHDGSHLYPGVREALEHIHAAGKKIIFVSNAPRRAHKVISVLTSLGVEPAIYDHAISSGEIGYEWLANHSTSPLVGEGGVGGDFPHYDAASGSPHLNPPPQGGRRYYYIGPSKDADILDGLDYRRSDDIKQADFLLNVGFGSEEQSTDDFSMLFRGAKAQGLPMVCLNPDLEVVKQTGERFPCAGVLAQVYERMGGKVTWFGKPYPQVYEQCFARLSPIPKSRILAVGDSLDTDIPGALNAGIDAMLVTGGILKKHSAAEIEALCKDCMPHYIAPRLAW